MGTVHVRLPAEAELLLMIKGPLVTHVEKSSSDPRWKTRATPELHSLTPPQFHPRMQLHLGPSLLPPPRSPGLYSVQACPLQAWGSPTGTLTMDLGHMPAATGRGQAAQPPTHLPTRTQLQPCQERLEGISLPAELPASGETEPSGPWLQPPSLSYFPAA